MKHTQEPWSIWTSCSWRRIGSDKTGELVCEPVTQNDGHPDLYFRNGGFEGPDAKRIISCVNALVGLEPESLDEFLRIVRNTGHWLAACLDREQFGNPLKREAEGLEKELNAALEKLTQNPES